MFQSVRAIRAGVLLVLAAGILGPLQASAVSITYNVTYLSGIRWQYDYTVTNNGTLPGSADVAGFDVFFDSSSTRNLAIVGAPATWNLLVFQPNAGLVLKGIFDGLADPGPGIANGNSQGGFSVSFDWLAGGTPGNQAFEIYDPNDFSVLETGGFTTVVPVPAAVWLFGSALAGLGLLRRRGSGAGAALASCNWQMAES